MSFRVFRLSALLFLPIVSGLSACGYSLAGSGSVLPQDVRTIAIPLAENDTTEPGLGQRFTEALRTRFDRYGAVQVVESETSADAVLNARITKIDTKVQGVTSNTDIALENQLVMTVSAELRRRNGQLLYRNPSLSASDNVAGISDVVVTSSSGFAQSGIGAGTLGTLGDREVARGQESQALDELLDEAARRLYMEAVAADF